MSLLKERKINIPLHPLIEIMMNSIAEWRRRSETYCWISTSSQ